MDRRFRDRADAGRQLAARLKSYSGRSDVIVLGIPHGGVVVALEVARAIGAPLDVFPVRKLGVPGEEELAMGAVAGGGICLLSRKLIQKLGLSQAEVNAVIEEERRELGRQEALYRENRAALEVAGRVVILIDDGLATGATMHAAVTALKERGVSRIVVAVPVAAPEVAAGFRSQVDELTCVMMPEALYAIGFWYEHFEQVTDAEVKDCLGKGRRGSAAD